MVKRRNTVSGVIVCSNKDTTLPHPMHIFKIKLSVDRSARSADTWWWSKGPSASCLPVPVTLARWWCRWTQVSVRLRPPGSRPRRPGMPALCSSLPSRSLEDGEMMMWWNQTDTRDIHIKNTLKFKLQPLTSVDDPQGVGHVVRHVGSDPRPQLLMDLLSLHTQTEEPFKVFTSCMSKTKGVAILW